MAKCGIAAVLIAASSASAQWQIVTPAPTSADLRGIDNVGKGIVWASGSEGAVLRSEDAGYLWQRCAIPPGAEHLDFRGIQAFDANTAIVMSSGKGALSRLYKTTDGCQTWTLLFTNPDPDGFWDAIGFAEKSPSGSADQRFGILVGDPVNGHFAIFFTYDFGNTWEIATKRVLKKLPKARKGEALFAASDSAALCAPDGGGLSFVTGGTGGSRYLHLVSGGLELDTFFVMPSFEQTPLPFQHRTDTQGAFSTAFRKLEPPNFDVMAVGGDYAHPDQSGDAVFIPTARYSWFMRHQHPIAAQTPPHGFRSAVAYDAASETWITVGPNGTDISTDDGRNWRALHPDPKFNDAPDADQHWNALSLPFAVGPHGRIGILRPLKSGAP